MKVLANNPILYSTPGDNEPKFSHSLVVLEDDDSYLKICIPYRLPTDIDIKVTKISAVNILPKYTEGEFSVAPCPLSDEVYIKKPDLLGFSKNESIRQVMLREARIYETLKRSPHPNIVEYKGIIQNAVSITGLALKRYDEDLFARLTRKDQPLNIDDCLQGITRGIEHLHNLGICHNDINPSNIMFGDDNVPVIIDFDSAQYTGRSLSLKRGTPGWTRIDAETSCQENDYYGLNKIKQFLKGFCNEYGDPI